LNRICIIKSKVMTFNYIVKFKQQITDGISEFRANATHLAAVIRSAFVVMVIRVAGAGIIYLSHVLLARWMGPFDFGVFAYAWVLVTVLGLLAPLGLNVAVVRFLPDYLSNKKWRRVNGVIRRSQVIVLAVSLLITGMASFVVFSMQAWIPDYYIRPLYIAFASITVFALIDLHEGLARSFGWVKLAFAPSYVFRPAGLIVLMALAIYVGIDPTPTVALIAVFISGVLALSAQAGIFRRGVRGVVPRTPPVYHSRYWIRNSVPFLLVEAFYLVLAHTDIIMLGKYLQPEDVAVYYAAVKTSGLISLILFAVSALSATKFSELYAQKKHQQLHELFTGAARLTFWPSLLAGIVLLMIGKPVLSLFGQTFIGGYLVLGILIFSVVLKAAAGPVDLLLNMTGHQDRCAVVLGCSAVLNIILNLLLIPLAGLEGAAVATTVSVVVGTVWLTVLAKNHLGITVFASLRF